MSHNIYYDNKITIHKKSYHHIQDKHFQDKLIIHNHNQHGPKCVKIDFWVSLIHSKVRSK